MDIASDRQCLELSVSNFGPIAEGRIELRPMTVFVGPSNTGKSYLAALIYALHRFFNGYTMHATGGPVPERFINLGMPQKFPTESLSLSESDINALAGWMTPLILDALRQGKPELLPYRIPDDIAALVRPIIADNVSQRGETLYDEIARCLGVGGASSLIRYPYGESWKFCLRKGVAGKSAAGFYEFTGLAGGHGGSVSALIPEGAPMEIGQDFRSSMLFSNLMTYGRDLHRNDPGERERRALWVLGSAASGAGAGMVSPMACPVYYLPADRGGIMHAHQLAVQGLIARASQAVLRPEFPAPALSGVISDFLGQLVGLTDWNPIVTQNNANALSTGLEREVIMGDIRIEQSYAGYPSFLYRPAGWERDLPLMNTSSMVSELAPVALYLRYVARPGDTLIIEEPESHLHPEMQVRLVRELASAVKAGIRIIITTHSEWVLEELANLVLMSELPPEKREGIEGADVALGPDEFGAWFFEPGKDGAGSTVREMPLDVEDGNFPSGFGLVTADLYNRWAKISNRIERDRYNADHDSK